MKNEYVQVVLHKNDVVSMIKGISPSYQVMKNPLVTKYGKYVGGHHDRWDWDGWGLEGSSLEELCDLYSVISKHNKHEGDFKIIQDWKGTH